VSTHRGRNLVSISVPFQPALLEAIGFLDERDLHVQSWLGDGIPDRFSELSDDHLVVFIHDVERIEENEEHEKNENPESNIDCRLFHFFTSTPRFSRGKMFF
jgi:hypothetical protein